MRAAFQRLRISNGATILYQHKPYGFLSPSSTPVGNKVFAIDLLTHKNNAGDPFFRETDPCDLPGLRVAGRLDADSTGLMVWSDDRSLVEHIIGQSSTVEKEYVVRVSGHEMWSSQQIDETLSELRFGMSLDGQPLKRAEVKRLNPEQLSIILTEGKHRQIRKMCALVGLQVEAIKRVRIGNLRLKGLGVGNWVALKPKQAAALFQPVRPWSQQERDAARYAPVRFGPGPQQRPRTERGGSQTRAERSRELDR